jgi:hypothetical protein
MQENTAGLAVKEQRAETVSFNGDNLSESSNDALSPAAKILPVSKQISKQDLIAEEKFLIEKENEVEKNYRGIGGYLRLFKVSKVIAMLSLYLYLDQYDVHHAQHLKQSAARMHTAGRLTWLAVLGEKFHQTNLAP